MWYTFRCRNSGRHKPHTALRIICCVLISLAFIAIIAILTIVTVKCVQDMPAVSILLGALDIIMIFLLLSILKRAYGTGKDKKWLTKLFFWCIILSLWCRKISQDICRRIEVVITGLTRNQFAGNRTWVRISPSAPTKPLKAEAFKGFIYAVFMDS